MPRARCGDVTEVRERGAEDGMAARVVDRVWDADGSRLPENHATESRCGRSKHGAAGSNWEGA
ncbi:hypothetical protein GCM10022227_13980 [Streptomyces sedi]